MPCGGRMGRPADLSRNSCASRIPSWPPFDTASARRDRLTELETKQDELTARLFEAPADIPDIRPNVAETYRRRIERLTVALAHPDDAVEAADAIREVIDRIVLTPGAKRGDLRITLHGDLDTILDWIERTGKSGYKPGPTPPHPDCRSRSKHGHVPAIHVFVSERKSWMPGTRPGMRECVEQALMDDALHRNRGGFAAADAQRRDAALQVLRLQRMQQRDDQARAGRADRVT